MILGLVLGACGEARKRAIAEVDAQWGEVNDKAFDKKGRRTIQASKQDAFRAARGAVLRANMVVEQQDYPTGFLFVSSAAPTPLTKEEWAEVQKRDTPQMRDIVADELGPLSWFATLDPTGKEVLVNVLVEERDAGVEVSLKMRMRLVSAGSDRARRLQPPPSAVQMGLEKFWSLFEEELQGQLADKSIEPEEPKDRTSPLGDKTSVSIEPSTAPLRLNPDGVAVIIGNRTYRGDVPAVEFAHNDADAMKRFVVEVLGFREGNIIDLRDAALTEMANVFGNERSYKGKLWRWVRPGESDVVVFYSGHGVPDAGDGRYLLPVDGDPYVPQIGGFSLELLFTNLTKLDARSVMVFLDACFSGESAGGSLLPKSGLSVTPKLPETKLTMLAAARGNQVASWDEEAQQGLFTRYLLDGLYGAADTGRYGNGDGRVTLKEVQTYLDREMSYSARRRYGREQNAVSWGNPNDILAAYRSMISSN
jgi:hypothetical protein